MANTKNITLTQGDTTRLIIPVVDNDDPDEKFEGGLTSYTIEFAVTDGSSTLLTASDVTAEFVDFGNTKVGASNYEAFDSIPDTQSVIRIELSATTTETLAVTGESPLQYQLRLHDSTLNTRVTVLRGTITVEGAVLEETA